MNASSFVLSRVEREEQKGFAGRGKQKGEDQRREGITCTNESGGRGGEGEAAGSAGRKTKGERGGKGERKGQRGRV